MNASPPLGFTRSASSQSSSEHGAEGAESSSSDATRSRSAYRTALLSWLSRLGTLRIRRALGPLLMLLAWQVASASGWISPRVLAAPSTVAETAWSLLSTGELQNHLLVSLERVFRGLGLGLSAAVLLALISGLFRLGEDLIDPPLQMLRTLPVLALVPLFILWFGIGETPKVLLVALGTLFPMYLNTYSGIRGIDNKLVEAAGTLGLPRHALIWHVILPAALPAALVGLRYSMGVAWLVLVISEQINATAGIGYLMTNAREFLRTDVILVGLCVYGLLGLATDFLVRSLERKVLVWRAAFVGQ